MVVKTYPKNYKGSSGRQVELGRSISHLLWRYRERSEEVNVDYLWKELIALEDIKGAPGSAVPPEDTLIYRIGGKITQIVKETKTINLTYTDGVITRVEDGIYRKDIIRAGGLITEIQVSIM